MVTFNLKKDKRFTYIIYTINSKGNVVELSKQQYLSQYEAVLWAKDFITSFPKSHLRFDFKIIEEL